MRSAASHFVLERLPVMTEHLRENLNRLWRSKAVRLTVVNETLCRNNAGQALDASSGSRGTTTILECSAKLKAILKVSVCHRCSIVTVRWLKSGAGLRNCLRGHHSKGDGLEIVGNAIVVDRCRFQRTDFCIRLISPCRLLTSLSSRALHQQGKKRRVLEKFHDTLLGLCDQMHRRSFANTSRC